MSAQIGSPMAPMEPKHIETFPACPCKEQEGGSMGGTLDVWRVNNQVLSLFHIQRWMRNLDGWDACLVSCKCEGIWQLASCTTMFEKSCNKASDEGKLTISSKLQVSCDIAAGLNKHYSTVL